MNPIEKNKDMIKAKRTVSVPSPNIISQYNKHMCGVDLLDSNLSPHMCGVDLLDSNLSPHMCGVDLLDSNLSLQRISINNREASSKTRKILLLLLERIYAKLIILLV